MNRKRVLRAGGWIAGSALFLTALMGFAHTPAGRPLLGALGRAFRGSACPLGYDRAPSPQARERARLGFAATHRGPAPAAGRPALGFELDRTTLIEVRSFMASRGITCREATAAADLVCVNVPGRLLPAAFHAQASRDLWFNFGTAHELTSVVAVSRSTTARQISAAFAGVTGTIAAQAGRPTRARGAADAASLGAGALRQASNEFAYADYYACARATNMGADFLLTEEYRSLPPRS
ncbi:MAG: hypothetical protein ABUS79_00970 [Pseudomonadota bacterium]